ncbi:MAG: ABC transporter ATP-binding protein [Actinomycetota bacterium]
MLELRGVTVRYGRTLAVDNCSLRVGGGEAVALLGANGAGKTSILRAVSRLVPVTGGSLTIDGIDLTSRRAHEVLATGLVHVPEGRGLFPDMTVLENLRMGAFGRPKSEAQEGVDFACDVFPRLRERLGQKSWSLSGGEQQMLAVGRALVARPRLLLLDEISLGLSPRATAELYGALATIRTGSGISMLIVEQQARLALANTDRVYVLRQGTVVLEGASADFSSDPARIWQAYVGGDERSNNGNGYSPGSTTITRLRPGRARSGRNGRTGSGHPGRRIVIKRPVGRTDQSQARNP